MKKKGEGSVVLNSSRNYDRVFFVPAEWREIRYSDDVIDCSAHSLYGEFDFLTDSMFIVICLNVKGKLEKCFLIVVLF